MAEIHDAIARLESALTLHAPQNLVNAAPPATDQHLAEIAERLAPLVLPQSIIEIAKWHDGGFTTTGGLHTHWLSLEQSFTHREETRTGMRQLSADVYDGTPLEIMPYPDEWFPVMDAHGLTIIVELTTEQRDDSLKWWYAHGGGPALDAFHSSVVRYLTYVAESHLRQDPGTSTALALEVDPTYGQHEWIEDYPNDWPDRWGTTL